MQFPLTLSRVAVATSVLALAAIAPIHSAWAGKTGPTIGFVIDQTPAATVSTEIGYGIQVSNSSQQNVNSILFTAPRSVSSDAGAAGTFLQVIGANGSQCSTTADNVVCFFGSASPGTSFEVTLIYAAPSAGTQVSLTGTLTYKEGTTDRSPTSAPNDSQTQTVSTTLLAAGDFTRAGRYLNSLGGTVVTGNDGATTEQDQTSIRIVVPGSTSAAAVGVELYEDQKAGNCSSAFICARAAIRAPGSYPAETGLLKAYFRIDAKTSKGNPSATALNYEAGVLKDGVFTASGAPFQLLRCSDPAFAANGNLPFAGAVSEQLKRCVNSVSVLGGDSTSVDFKDVEVEIFLTENGRVSLR